MVETETFEIQNSDEYLKFWVQKMASYLHHTAQPSTLAAFPPWGIQQELVV